MKNSNFAFTLTLIHPNGEEMNELKAFSNLYNIIILRYKGVENL